MHHVAKNSEFHLTPNELARLVQHAATERDRLVILVLACTGIRRAELQQLRREDVEYERRRLIIRRGKGGKQRIVYLPQWLLDQLITYSQALASGYLFPGRHEKPLALRSINYILARAGDRAGIANPNPRYTHVSPHLLRHSFARNWKRNGGSLESLQKILGHASMSTTLDLYGTESQEETEENYHQMAPFLLADGGCARMRQGSSS